MIHLALRTEYTFKRCFGFIDDFAKRPESAIGIADDNNTFGHVTHHRNCLKEKRKPILGVRLMVIDAPVEKKKVWGPKYIFIAKNQDGLRELYSLVRTAHDRFYYHPRLFQVDLQEVSKNIIVIANTFNTTAHIDYIAIDQTTPDVIARWPGIPKVAISLNWYPSIDDKQVYQLHAGRNSETQTYPQHILSDQEWLRLWPEFPAAIQQTYAVADQCEEYSMPTAPMVKYKGTVTLRELCISGARKRKIDLKDPVYGARLDRELELIAARNYSDYFLIVAQMVRVAKQKMLVGPSRGSSAGSLVCFLAEITEVDPIKFDLLFERFVDPNRADLPDIDIDFPDLRRKLVISELEAVYGAMHVSRIATVSTMKPKSAIGEFAMGLGIPAYETDAVKGAIIERSSADARAMMRIEDTFTDTEIGRDFIEQYPEMKIVRDIEGHARHSGVHAAGVIVCVDPLTDYGGINSRDGSLMMDYRDAERLNLLKIDCLGLRTLSILESVADQIGMPYSDYYKLPLDDPATFAIFNSLRLSGIFQFQGNALQYVTRQMGVETFDDISAITALGRPGPIHSGGTNTFVSRRVGDEPVEYLSQHESVIRHTEGTYGVIIYQEQLMSIGREYGGLSWEDVSELRRAASKSMGEEYFNRFKEKFVDGAIKNGADKDEASKVWDAMVTFGCLSGETQIPLPTSNQYSPKSISIKELCDNNGYACIASGTNRAIQIKRGPSKLLCMADDVLKPQQLVKVYQSGIKITFRLRIASGDEIRATETHQFWTLNGWVTLGMLSIGDSVAINGGAHLAPSWNKRYPGTGSGAHNKKTGVTEDIEWHRTVIREGIICKRCDVYAEEVHHIDSDRTNNLNSNIEYLCRCCHKASHCATFPYQRGKLIKFSTIVSIDNPKKEMTYDIEMPQENPNFVANNFIVHNSWGFNKSHAYSYGLISYWTAWTKAHHPMEFAVANMNHARNEQQAVRILRDMVRNDKIEYVAFDPEESVEEWSIHDGKLLGGLRSLKGIGPKKAKQILKARADSGKWTPSLIRALAEPETVFNILFPCEHYWGDLFNDPRSVGLEQPPVTIETVIGPGKYLFVGRMLDRNLRDLNETQSVARRGGKYLTDHTLFLNLIVEDDTDLIVATIGRYQYERIGKDIAETGKIGESWYLIKGTIKDKWRRVDVEEILNLNEWRKQDEVDQKNAPEV